MSQIEDLLQRCTVKLMLPDRMGWGTGFFVATGWILTCAHVVRAADDSLTETLVYLASRDNSTKIQMINVEEAEQSIPRELGIRLSSLFMFDRLVFVEEPTDEDVIREWASICGINLAQASVGFVPMGGVRNLAHFATEATGRIQGLGEY
jgi:hypothetical protein